MGKILDALFKATSGSSQDMPDPGKIKPAPKHPALRKQACDIRTSHGPGANDWRKGGK